MKFLEAMKEVIESNKWIKRASWKHSFYGFFSSGQMYDPVLSILTRHKDGHVYLSNEDIQKSDANANDWEIMD